MGRSISTQGRPSPSAWLMGRNNTKNVATTMATGKTLLLIRSARLRPLSQFSQVEAPRKIATTAR